MMKPGLRMAMMNGGEMNNMRYRRIAYDEGGMPAEMRRRRDGRGRYMEDDYGPEMSGYGGNERRRYAGYERRNRYRDMPEEYYTPDAEDYKRPESVYGAFWMEGEHDHHQHQERGQSWEEEDEGQRTQSMDKEMAHEWVESMKGSDPSHPHGPRWKADEVKLYAQRAGFPAEGNKFYEFWAVMNAMYSDYYEVGKKYGVNNPEFYADLAKGFLNDKDAVKNKAQIYFDCIVKHD